MMRSYFTTNWNLDLDKLRAVIMDHSDEVKTMDLRTLD